MRELWIINFTTTIDIERKIDTTSKRNMVENFEIKFTIRDKVENCISYV